MPKGGRFKIDSIWTILAGEMPEVVRAIDQLHGPNDAASNLDTASPEKQTPDSVMRDSMAGIVSKGAANQNPSRLLRKPDKWEIDIYWDSKPGIYTFFFSG